MSSRRERTTRLETRTGLKAPEQIPPPKPEENPDPIADCDNAANPYLRTILLQSKLQLMLFEHNEQLRHKNEEIAESRRRFAHLFNLAPIGYLTLDSDYKIVESNIACATMLVLPGKELAGRDFLQYVSRDYVESFHQHRNQATIGKRDSFELELVTSLGRPIHTKIETYLNSDMRWLMAIVDISARKKAEDQLKSAKDELRSAYELLRAQTVQRQQAEDKLRKFTQKLIDAQETERRRISRELHDNVGQLMTYLGLLLDKIRPKLDPETFNDAKSVAREVLSQIRSLSSDLQPSMLASIGLLPSLRELFDRYTVVTKIEVQFDCDHIKIELPEDANLAAFRIIQEALTNVARYANVDKVRVRLIGQSRGVRIEVEDDGKGFDLISERGCTGLTGMKERAQAIGGNLWISSAPGQGTKIVAELPTQLPPQLRTRT